jgi:hypothetical protein
MVTVMELHTPFDRLRRRLRRRLRYTALPFDRRFDKLRTLLRMYSGGGVP